MIRGRINWKVDKGEKRGGGNKLRRLMNKKSMRARAERKRANTRYRAVGARARCAFTRALNTVNALSGTTSLLSPPSVIM